MYINIATFTSLFLTLLATIPSTDAAIDGHCNARIKVKKSASRSGETNVYTAEVPGLNGKNNNCILVRGDKGNAVEVLQGNLNECYTNNDRTKRIKVDGDFGGNTQSLLKSAQRLMRIDDDGKYGLVTRKNMFVEGVVTNSRGQFLTTCLLPFD